ncbi:zinc finger protein 502-like [Folsomia candida]|uniref:zinc finger protein 502-like n=1 Tax=Folsomia candida TaxID=158441 RepID=UPI001604E099|nr:zinc finger protein 502-like [Folsomia candida]
MNPKPRKKWECPTCSKTFTTKRNLTQHGITHDPSAQIKCKICGKVSKSPVRLAAHMKGVHSNRERSNCDICHRTYRNSSSLQRHVDVVHGTRERSRFPCTFSGCEKTYLNQGHLLEHVRAEHVENPLRFSARFAIRILNTEETWMSTFELTRPRSPTIAGLVEGVSHERMICNNTRGLIWRSLHRGLLSATFVRLRSLVDLVYDGMFGLFMKIGGVITAHFVEKCSRHAII